ncbi:hypothetical protein [Couchioplanes caeruleus]|uniref:Uncharacterized protein n=2 Tax=Couchioplanes caeruleus TaxID=56438 RepID=A0A1K0GL83_9ACTN|nr:hypothetical protein [Couchioplanes caeruleus]OJF13062.1 hypothetical protein BG844_17315 [Couchioplanes caeruleus subsp. caeruleus]ROP32921.1 hypothetical protein EDD30_5877 [Couchioplanes caeruleus]
MSEQAPDRLWSGIQISKVIAGTLAAVAAAVLGSYLGVAGTLAGAALASVVGSVGTELFNNSLKRGTKRLQTVAPTFVKVPAAVGTPAVAAATAQENPAHTVAPRPRRKIRWGHVALAACALFALSMGAVSLIEAFTDKPISATVRHTSGNGTTLFGGRDDSSPKTPVTPSPKESTTEEAPTGETSTPDPSTSEPPATDAPQETPTTTAPVTPEPTTEATTQAPGPGAAAEPDEPGQQVDPGREQEEQEAATE